MTNSPLDNKRLVEQLSCNSVFSRLFYSVNIKTGARAEINCKSWRCPKHREQWGRKWGAIIGRQLESSPCNLLVNLTTAEMTSNTVIEAAMRFFIRRFRAIFGPTEYVRTTEYNRRKTQPHFHCLLICPGLSVASMPKNYPKELSWPDDIFRLISYYWQESLAFAAPGARYTKVVWCQPPKDDNGAKSAFYAIGYITGKTKKDEEPDNTWRGRKLTYSSKFFSRPTAVIWRELLTEWFGPPDADTRFFWVPKPDLDFTTRVPFHDETSLEKLLKMPILATRWQEAEFYYRNGSTWPTNPSAPSPTVYFEIDLSGQEIFSSG